MARRLKASLDVAPAPATQQLAAQLAAQTGIGKTTAPALEPRAAAPAPVSSQAQDAVTGTGVSHSLPLPFSRFFGREEELTRLLSWLGDSQARLVTLTGTAGAGKTRLALEAARRLLEQECFAGALWFVPLADLGDATRIADAVREAISDPRRENADTLGGIVEAVAGRRCLLVLDNMEHLGTPGAAWVETLLQRAPALTCLATSRCALGLTGGTGTARLAAGAAGRRR